jgi:hypothetical protein
MPSVNQSFQNLQNTVNEIFEERRRAREQRQQEQEDRDARDREREDRRSSSGTTYTPSTSIYDEKGATDQDLTERLEKQIAVEKENEAIEAEMARYEKTAAIESEMRREEFGQEVNEILAGNLGVDNPPAAGQGADSDMPINVNEFDEIVSDQPEYRSAFQTVRDNLTVVKELVGNLPGSIRSGAATMFSNNVITGLMEKIYDETSDQGSKMPSFYEMSVPGPDVKNTDLLPTIGRGIRDRVVGAVGDYLYEKVTDTLSDKLRGWVRQQKNSGSDDPFIQNLTETDLDLNIATFLPKILHSPTERAKTIREQVSSAMNRVMTNFGLFGDETFEKAP